ncbi:MAG TPA: dihydroneopterin aldolase [Clostridiaceae bacterium]|nr:dihydroneopterin aldolase [Clostridiaceae bacterium]
MRNMKFFGYHGVLPEEKEKGQNFIIDIEILADLENASESDELCDSVDYSKAYDLIKNIVEKNKFRLIEKLAGSISREMLSKFPKIQEITVVVKKPEAPIDGEFDWMGVELKRGRNEK